MDAHDEVDALRAAMHRDPSRVVEAAGRLVAGARAGADPALLSRALAVLGRARRALGVMELAEADLLAAIEAADVAGDRELAADAHLGVAGVYAFTGRSAEALAALDHVHRLGSPRIQAYGQLQRAALAQRIGRPYEALAGYERALPTLRKLDARVDIALVLMNRGVIRTQLADCDAAIADLTEAGRLFADDGNRYGHAQTLHGLGWAFAGKGELATALRHLDDATDRFRELGHPAPEVEVDRGEVLLAAGLSGLAAEAAHEAARRLTVAGDHWHVALAWLLCARAKLLDGRRDDAVRYAERARSMFAEHGSVAWERTARLELIRARTGGDRPVEVSELCVLAEEFDQAGNARAAATALSLASVAAAESDGHEVAGRLAAECARRAARLGLFEVRMQARHAMAVCAAARGDDASARRQLRIGLADLRRRRTSIAALDAQAAVATHAGQLAALGLRLALRDGSASAMLSWMERVRTFGPNLPAARPPDDDELAGRLTELRATVSQVRAAEADGRDTADLLRRQRDLERLIHRGRLRATAAGAASGDDAMPSVDALVEALHGGSLIELAEIDGRLVGVAVRAPYGARLVDLGAGQSARDAVDAAGTALRTLLTESGAAAGRAARIGLLRRAVGVLDRMLAPLLSGDGPVVLVVPAALHAAAWQLLPGLAGRPVAVAPSATWWHADRAAGHDQADGDRVVAVAGPRLAMADREAAAVAGCYPNATVLTGRAATGAAVLAAMAGAGLAHIACHGQIRDDNALWSSLALFDGPLYLYDLERAGRTPPLVVLSGCETGIGMRVGDQLIGLSTVLLRHGTTRLVAARSPLPDSTATSETMTALHRRIAGGAAPAAALAQLTTGWAGDDAGALVAAALGCFGRN
jgi:tetratricopeptide (TPR) repeat protein